MTDNVGITAGNVKGSLHGGCEGPGGDTPLQASLILAVQVHQAAAQTPRAEAATLRAIS